MLLSVLKDLWRVARASSSRGSVEPPSVRSSPVLPPVWAVYGDYAALQQGFDAAVIMPTVGRPSLGEAVQSVYEQAFDGRIQLLIGVDAPLGSFEEHELLFAAAPPNVTVCFYYPGYSTSVRHGGLHPARDGGVLRAVLTYMAHSRYVAYLDDDNRWNPLHLQSLLSAIQGRDWAYADRWFLHQDSREVACADDWESVGPGRGVFADMNGGWVDPNCLMFDKLACEPVIRWWTIPLSGDRKAMSADRHVYNYLQQKSAPSATGLITTYYALQPDDGMHPFRLEMMEGRGRDNAYAASRPYDPTGICFSFLLPTRDRVKGLADFLASVEATTARPNELEIVLGIDEDDHATRDFEWDSLNLVKVIVPPGLPMGALNQACYDASRGRYLMAMNDDVLLRTQDWDDQIRLMLDAVRDDIFLVHVNDKLFGPKLCCFPLVSRTFCNMAGGFCPGEYERYRIDDHIHQIFSLLAANGHNRIFYLPNIVFEHLNYVAIQDGRRVYALHGEILSRDARRFDESLPARQVLAETLTGHIMASRNHRISVMEELIRRTPQLS